MSMGGSIQISVKAARPITLGARPTLEDRYLSGVSPAEKERALAESRHPTEPLDYKSTLLIIGMTRTGLLTGEVLPPLEQEVLDFLVQETRRIQYHHESTAHYRRNKSAP